LKLATIDIGSNAIRLQVSSVLHYGGEVAFKKLEYVRFPLRLGHDVFNDGSITTASCEKFLKLMHAFVLLTDLYKVDHIKAVATSAMREADNGAALAAAAKVQTGIEIEIIDGPTEAAMIGHALTKFIDNTPHLHIDVGGGSTELNLYMNQQKQASASFKLGSVRMLNHQDKQEAWDELHRWVIVHTTAIDEPITAIGTGGNINKLFDLAHPKASKRKQQRLSYQEARAVQQYIEGHSIEQRINLLQLNPDRADVILPATEIYLSVMQWAGIETMVVPDVGLKDGLMEYMYHKHYQQQAID